MDRQEIKNRIIKYFQGQINLKKTRPEFRDHTQMGTLYELFRESANKLPSYKQADFYSIIREVIHEFINANFIYPGTAEDFNSGYPWLSITEYGKEIFSSENWLPYDPDGYLKALKEQNPEIDDITLSYIGESIFAFHRRHLLAATITLGVASENLMLFLIEAYAGYLAEPRKSKFLKAVNDRWISTQYKVFREYILSDIKSFPKELQGDWETYLDGVFNFIRLNRNNAGHPTGKELDAKVIYANLQIFSDYAKYIFKLIKFFSASK